MPSGVTLLTPGGCGDEDDCYPCGDCEPPTASCELVTEEGVRELNWEVTGAVEAWIIKSCPGYYGSSETRIDLSLTAGDGSGTISPADPLCFYTVHAVNECDEVTSQCFIGCPEIDCSIVPPCQCVEVPSGLVRDNTYSINLNITGIVRGQTFTLIGEGAGTYTTEDVDISGTYGFTFAREFNEFDECINFPFASPGFLILHQEYLFTDSIGRDWFAVIRLYPGNGIGSAIVPESDLESSFFFADEYMRLPLTEFRACLAACTCPTARMQTTTWATNGNIAAFDSSGVIALGLSE